MKKHPKLLLGITAAIAVIAVVIISIVMAAAGKRKDTYDSHMELGARYLSELDYENAIVAYEAAIEIDPMNENAYLRLADVYVAMGDIEKALEVLEEGYALTQSEVIAARQEELIQWQKKQRLPEQQEEQWQEESYVQIPTFDPMEPGFYIGSYDNKVVVYLSDGETIYMETEVLLNTLPDDIQQEINQMMWLEDEDALYDFFMTYDF